jgi:4-hydroxybenzoate polyprenyltransferase
MATSTVSAADVLFGQATPTEPSFRNEIIAFITLQRIAIGIMTLPIVIAPWALAGGRFDDPRLPFLLIVAWLVVTAGNITNDIVDTERDKRKWPLRPIPTGLVSRSAATLYVIIIAGIALMMAGLIFNWLFAVLTLLVLALGYVYTRYTRDKIGYLTVILPLALIPVAVWTAMSPRTVFTLLPWLLFAFTATLTAASQFTNEPFDPEAKALFVRPRPFTEMVLYVILVVAMFILGTTVFFYIKVSWLYMVVLAAFTVCALTQARYLGEHISQDKLQKAFRLLSIWVIIYWLSVTALVWIK